VLFNLVNNAVKFTECGGIHIRVSWAGGSLLLEVSDTGPGISETSRVRLFHRFEQEDSPQRSIGSGLGLAICNELVELMGGSMTLESALGKGSTFRVRLPLQVAPEAAPAAPEPARQARSLDVLLVEGDAVAAHAIRGMLEHQGHRVRHASHGLNALAELAVESCDLILLEVDLPGIDGLQVAQLIRHGEVAGRHVPIIATTTRDDEEEMVRGHQVGVDAFLRKPISGAQLAAALQTALAARPAPRERDPA